MDVDHNVYSKISGKVLLYTSRDLGASPAMTIAHDTVSRLPPVLQKLARRFSPLRKMDSRIYVSEDKMWAAKGRFSQAILDDDPIAWDVSYEGKYTLSLLAVSI